MTLPDGSPDTADARATPHILRRLLVAWAGIALVQAGIWLVLGRSGYLRPLWQVPAVIVLLFGLWYSWRIARRGSLGDRRGTKPERRRRRSRRER